VKKGQFMIHHILKNARGCSAFWPLIGCLLAGGLLAFEYVYAIIKMLEVTP